MNNPQPAPRATPATPGSTPGLDWDADARVAEYTTAANPRLAPVPFAVLPAAGHLSGPTRSVPFDLSAQLGTAYPATAPNLLAGFLRIRAHETLPTAAQATSQLCYVIRGAGTSATPYGALDWAEGDLFVMPGDARMEHTATADSALYWVTDEPLLAYLGVRPGAPRFKPTRFRRAYLFAELDAVRRQPGAGERNRLGILLGNAATEETRTVTHTLWSLLNVLPAGVTQKPHRHNSVALDLCISAEAGVYTLMGPDLTADGQVRNPVRADWQAGSAFTTPPGWWHSHHNESGKEAMVLPVQDAGLQTWMRTLDIRFVI